MKVLAASVIILGLAAPLAAAAEKAAPMQLSDAQMDRVHAGQLSEILAGANAAAAGDVVGGVNRIIGGIPGLITELLKGLPGGVPAGPIGNASVGR